ncbi:phosphate/phosphite/phosphonate ABC transporter substrate-binding protein [Okeania sp. SIO3B5]|uniref:phosphate/phosphite/phosphonate ABC transporter substrate-binding protein n=1 Tax=Okeania sp. SIO3B5 TaxID=2607811 RepID=UPI0025F2D373|nr:PhnD/SsuA/transferrin family substrate-binding protein [Okeania sp. SIO3B5]
MSKQINKTMLRRYFIGYILLFVAGCTTVTNNQRKNSNNSLLKDQEKLRFAVSGIQSLANWPRDYTPFRVALEEVLETKIEFVPIDSLMEATALQLALVDIVLAGPSEYAIIKARTNAVPIVAVTRPTYRAVIVVRKDSEIKSLADLKDKTIELGKIGSTGSYLGQIKMLMDAGLNIQSDVNILNSKEYHFKALKNGEVDAWGRTSHRYEKTMQQEGVSQNDYLLLAESPRLPNDVFIASSKLEPMVVAEIRERMLKNKEKMLQAILSIPPLPSKYEGGTLVPAEDSDYDMIREVYKAIGEENFIK